MHVYIVMLALKNITCILSEKIVSLKKQAINDRIQLAADKIQIASKEQQIDDIYNSYTFKLSKIILYPLKIIKKLFKT